MVDRLRAYRRWRRRRLGLLLSVLVGALATQLWLAAGSSAPGWLRVVSLGSSGLVLALVGYFLAQTVLCDRLHRRGDRAGARALREQLAPSGRAALAAAGLLAILSAIPSLIPSAPEQSATRTPMRRQRYPFAPESPIVESLEAPEPPPAAEPIRPALRPIVEELPVHLAIQDSDLQRVLPDGLPLLGGQVQPPDAVASGGEEGLPRFRPDVQDGFLLDGGGSVVLTLERMGLPRQEASGEWIPPEMRLDVSFLRGRGEGSELSLFLDVPIGPDESLQTTIALSKFVDEEEFLEGSPSTSWQRVTLAYSRRLAGHTRHAFFDLSVSIGVNVDRFRIEGMDGPLDTTARLSPSLSVDAALWQEGPAGFLLHAGYSMPVNFTGASSNVLDLSATVRIDLSESISVHVGYRYLILRLRRYEDSLVSSHSRGEFSDDFSGPLVGLDVRF